ncbi:MAG: SDR family NAD(P)-dependent oxidoreductase [Saprospiraceae bacterium]|nr:SDR family NAD(P)-dependent oxidoreductase [Saprospiraceae bacterium]MCB0574252.1 SDR family NAD(P)-dependent oxidoreductase [Saprospiraceae bacterium]MCB9305294.1 SDR family NAD(P)-dependent oxidoreductase [Lewinellaceae bacterium]MCB9356062.1 SDR family NAD(P)-dependent oxidoreductase [Lewinellaceae bacterium]
MTATELFSLENKTAVVTGATGLIGSRHCRALAEAGAQVVVADLAPAQCEALQKTLPGGPHLSLPTDVTDPGSLQDAREIILRSFGSIDVLVNNAAINDMFEHPALAAWSPGKAGNKRRSSERCQYILNSRRPGVRFSFRMRKSVLCRNSP